MLKETTYGTPNTVYAVVEVENDFSAIVAVGDSEAAAENARDHVLKHIILSCYREPWPVFAKTPEEAERFINDVIRTAFKEHQIKPVTYYTVEPEPQASKVSADAKLYPLLLCECFRDEGGCKTTEWHLGGRLYNRLPFTPMRPEPHLGGDWPWLTKKCPGCGVEYGGLHHGGCTEERCPRCGGQYQACICAPEDGEDDYGIDLQTGWDEVLAIHQAERAT